MFRCNLTNGRGKTNLFDVELLLIVNATAEFSLFLCANNYSRELSATFVFLPPFSSPLLVHVLLLPPVFDVSLRPREISMTEINAIYTSIPFGSFRAILVSNNHCSKNKSFNLLFHQVVYAMNTLSARYALLEAILSRANNRRSNGFVSFYDHES